MLGQWDECGGSQEQLDPKEEFTELFAPISSAEGPIAYVEAEFFGGAGTQASAVFKAGRLISGPIIDSNAICIALAQVGVARTLSCDEFDALDLGRFRFTDDWETAKN